MPDQPASRRNTRLAGHGLPNEGRVYVRDRGHLSRVDAPAVCECGTKSGPLPNATQRKRWHATHKQEVADRA